MMELTFFCSARRPWKIGCGPCSCPCRHRRRCRPLALVVGRLVHLDGHGRIRIGSLEERGNTVGEV